STSFDWEIVEGTNVEAAIKHQFANADAEYLHTHFAAPGCYAARVDRVAYPKCEAPLCGTANLEAQCPLWVKSRHCKGSTECPLCPQKRTSIERVRMSALCQKQTFCVAAKSVVIRSPGRA